MRKYLSMVLSFLIVVGMATFAQALVIFDDWTLDLRGVNGLANDNAFLYEDVDQITYFGIAHSQTIDTNGNFLPDVGELGTTDGLLTATNIRAGGVLAGISGFEMTFDFSIDAIGVDRASTGLDFVHIGPTNTDGILEIWVDNLTDAVGVQSSTSTGLGYTDGELVATFQIVPGDGGIFTPATFDGSDDATFALVSAKAGVFTLKDGTDLADWVIGDPAVTMGITDSNFDADPIASTPGAFSVLTPTGLPGWAPIPLASPIDFIAEEDGSARLGVVPEPTTMMLMGFGLLGLGIVTRKKYKK